VETPSWASVRLGGVELFDLRAPFGSISAEERAELASRKLEDALRDPEVGPEQVIAAPAGRSVLIGAGRWKILEVTPADAAAHDSSPAVLADHWADLIRQELGRRKSEAFSLVLIGRFLLGMLYPVAILLVLWVGLLLLDRAREWVELRPAESLPVVRLLGLEILGPLAVRRLQIRLLGLARFLLYLGLGYAFLLALFSQFPQTRLYARRMIGFVLDALGGGLAEILTWLPRVLAGLVIVAAARLVIRLTGLLFGRVQSGRLTLPPFLTPDTAVVSEAIVRALVVLVATALLALLIPGERGRPVLAVLFLLGLVGAFALAPAARQLMAGILLAYVGPAPTGARVEIDGLRGTVVRRRTFHTIILTEAGEEVWVPNHAVLTRRVLRLGAPDAGSPGGPAPGGAAPGGSPTPGAAPPPAPDAAPPPA
jgi:small-conductance mechanosensitive channel